MTGYEAGLINKLKSKEKLSVYDYLYLICVQNELSMRMTMITTALTLIFMYLLMGWIHNPFLLLVTSLVVSFYLTIVMYTTFVGILLTPFVVFILMVVVVLVRFSLV